MSSSTVERRFIIGAGAQGRVILEIWRAQHPDGAFAFLDDGPGLVGQERHGAPIAGPVAALPAGDEAVIAIGHNLTRMKIAAAAGAARWGQPVHPSAVVSPSAQVGPGTVIAAGAVVNTEARLGAHVVVNTGVLVEHDCVVEDGASLSPGVCMGGRVVIGAGAFLSVGVTLAPRITIGAGTVVGAGAVVVADLPPGVLAYGVPARVQRPLRDEDWSRLL
jgi:acetyltransferase EpsM